MDKNYKEIIFLNETELYSALAQLNKGYIDSLIDKSSNNYKSGESDTSAGTAGIEGGIPTVMKGAYKDTNSHTSSSEDSESYGKDRNVVLNDYNLSNLIESLRNNNMLKILSASNEGDFVLFTSDFSLTDFKFSSKVLGAEHGSGINSDVKNMMKSTDSWSKEAEDNFKAIAHFMKFGNLMTQGNVLIRMNGATILASNSHFRMNNGELQSIAYTSRKLTVLGIVEAKTNEVSINSITSKLSESKPDINDLSMIGSIVPSLSEMTFYASGLLKSGDRFIKPIALFFN